MPSFGLDKRKKLGHLRGVREAKSGGFFFKTSGGARGGKKEKILWVETPKGKSISRRSILGLGEEE